MDGKLKESLDFIESCNTIIGITRSESDVDVAIQSIHIGRKGSKVEIRKEK
jgi:hypothetical protein